MPAMWPCISSNVDIVLSFFTYNLPQVFHCIQNKRANIEHILLILTVRCKIQKIIIIQREETHKNSPVCKETVKTTNNKIAKGQKLVRQRVSLKMFFS